MRWEGTLSCSTVVCRSNRRSERVSGEMTNTLTVLDMVRFVWKEVLLDWATNAANELSSYDHSKTSTHKG